MKTIFKSIFAALPAMAFWACSNPDILEELRPGETVNLTISTDRPDMVDTRTMVDTDGRTPMWCPEDAIGVSVLSNGSYTNHEFTNDNTDAPSIMTSFSGSVDVGDMIYTYYPYTKGNVTADGQILMTIPDVQYPTPTSFDGAADILVGKPVEMTPATTKIEELRFRRMGGFLKIVLKDQTSGNLLADEQVNTLSISADEQLVGQNSLDIINCRLDDAAGNYDMTVTAEYTSKTQYRIGDDKAATWFGVYPQTLAEGSTLVISAKTRGYEIQREVTFPRDIEIKAGGITTLAVNIYEANISERTLYIDEIFPDPIFRQYVLDNFDTDKNGKLSKNEILAVTYINVDSYSTPAEEKITSLEGIQHFANLKYLSCRYNQLTTLDVSGCTALEWLDCYPNKLTTLDVSGCTALTELNCFNNQLTTLDVSDCTALTGLLCYNNQLTTLDLSRNTGLINLECDSNQLTTLDVSGCTALEHLRCDYNQLTTLDLSNNTALEYFGCWNNQLTTLDLSQNTALERLSCGSNQLTTLDLSNNTALKDLYCDNNPLTTLDVSKNTALTTLGCHYNKLTTLDVSKNTALTSLSCYNNQLTTLDLSKNTELIELWCGDNQLTTLDLSKTNLGNSTNPYPLYCAPMETLQTLYLKTGWVIPYITPNRNSEYIPDQTEIVFIDGD